MPAYTMSHVICTSALIALVFLMQFSFMYVSDNLRTEMIRRELKEISDYVSDSLANLYFLANSTDYSNVTLEKTLSLPSDVQGLTYDLSIYYNATTLDALSVNTSITGSLWAEATSWLLPSVKVDSNATEQVVSGGKTVVAGCRRAGAYSNV
ncbi:MAG: hypothetical protein ACETVP_02260, partial [Candidatus Bathyarchaeia archaeon]